MVSSRNWTPYFFLNCFLSSLMTVDMYWMWPWGKQGKVQSGTRLPRPGAGKPSRPHRCAEGNLLCSRCWSWTADVSGSAAAEPGSSHRSPAQSAAAQRPARWRPHDPLEAATKQNNIWAISLNLHTSWLAQNEPFKTQTTTHKTQAEVPNQSFIRQCETQETR